MPTYYLITNCCLLNAWLAAAPARLQLLGAPFLAERPAPDAQLTQSEIRAFLLNLNEQDTTASAYRRAEVALELLIEGLLERRR